MIPNFRYKIDANGNMKEYGTSGVDDGILLTTEPFGWDANNWKKNMTTGQWEFVYVAPPTENTVEI